MYTTATFTYRVTSLIAILVTSMMLALPASAAKDAYGTKKLGEDPYQAVILQQIRKIAATAEQMEPFRAELRNYFKIRNGSTRRISRQGGDIAIKVSRDLRRCAKKSVEAMSKVLTPDQLKLYEELVELGNKQYLTNSGLI